MSAALTRARRRWTAEEQTRAAQAWAKEEARLREEEAQLHRDAERKLAEALAELERLKGSRKGD